jgi:hypothetical protein
LIFNHSPLTILHIYIGFIYIPWIIPSPYLCVSTIPTNLVSFSNTSLEISFLIYRYIIHRLYHFLRNCFIVAFILSFLISQTLWKAMTNETFFELMEVFNFLIQVCCLEFFQRILIISRHRLLTPPRFQGR